jgi:hypothetical protein
MNGDVAIDTILIAPEEIRTPDYERSSVSSSRRRKEKGKVDRRGCCLLRRNDSIVITSWRACRPQQVFVTAEAI